MKITFLGTGTSQGVPVIACKCKVCNSTNTKDKRLRSSVLFELSGQIILIDAGPDFRQQMLRAKVEKLDAVILTHEHKDHIGGLDDVRALNYVMKKACDIYAEKRVHTALKREYSYVFAELKYPGIPKMNLHEINDEVFYIGSIKIEPIRIFHHKLPILGFKIANCAYLTDTNMVEDLSKLYNLDILIINALRKEKHISHFSLEESLELIKKVKPKKAFLTHVSHLMGLHDLESKELPENVFFAYDELEIEINNGEIIRME
jgi:phosphoribosyl 1,2-cyclic phosphate phosphodiesterase